MNGSSTIYSVTQHNVQLPAMPVVSLLVLAHCLLGEASPTQGLRVGIC